jgi:L-threonylcarbamoyladenylate synthase
MSRFTIYLKKEDDPTVFINRAAEIVKEGGIIAFPTDTVYGMGSDPFNIEVVKQIFKLKNRNSDQGFPILVADLDEAKKIGIFGQNELILAENFWPGQLTIVVPLKMKENGTSLMDKIVTGGKETVAIRVPQNEIILGICKELKSVSNFGGLIGTSANISGEPNPTSGRPVIDQFSWVINMIIDSGKCKEKIPSTIVHINQKMLNSGESLENSVIVFREGKITKKEILETLK